MPELRSHTKWHHCNCADFKTQTHGTYTAIHKEQKGKTQEPPNKALSKCIWTVHHRATNSRDSKCCHEMVVVDILCPGEKGNKKTEITHANKYFFLPPFNFWEPLHLTAWLEEHNHKHFRRHKALDVCWASKQEQPSELGKARAKKIIRPQSCHLLKQNKDTAPFGFYIYVAFQNPFLGFHLRVLRSS